MLLWHFAPKSIAKICKTKLNRQVIRSLIFFFTTSNSSTTIDFENHSVKRLEKDHVLMYKKKTSSLAKAKLETQRISDWLGKKTYRNQFGIWFPIMSQELQPDRSYIELRSGYVSVKQILRGPLNYQTKYWNKWVIFTTKPIKNDKS